ncbi:MAG: SDR family NAD(P)-dependent oxidoreductase [Bacteroidota bacterium]
MRNKNIILTGGHSGMGLELTKILKDEGHNIGLILRSEKRKNDAIEELGDSQKITFFYADLSKREEIQKVAEKIRKDWEHIDVLFNNAGVLLDKLYFSDYGNELQLEINAISPYILTTELLPLLGKSEKATVINTATTGLNKKKSINIPNFKNPKKFTKLTGSYIDSKFIMVLLMNHISTENPNIRIISVDPGAIKTKMTAGDGMPFWLKPIRNLLFKSPEEGARNLYAAAFNTNFSQSGIYVSKGNIKKMSVAINGSEIKDLLS